MKRFLTTMCTVLMVLSVMGLSACTDEPTTKTPEAIPDCETCLDEGCGVCREDHCDDCDKHEDECLCPDCAVCSDEGCAVCCEHNYAWVGTDYKCSICDDVEKTCAAHDWTNGVCTECNTTCTHPAYDATTGDCTTCDITCAHTTRTWVVTGSVSNNTCSTCSNVSATCTTHTYGTDSKCTTCAIDCGHSYAWVNSEDKCSMCNHIRDTCTTHTWVVANPMSHTSSACSKCGITCSGDVELVTDANQHVWKCKVCPFENPGSRQDHGWDDATGKCSTCQYECAHTSAGWGRAWGGTPPNVWGTFNLWQKQCGDCNFVVDTCGPTGTTAHNYTNGVCIKCTAPCEHNYSWSPVVTGDLNGAHKEECSICLNVKDTCGTAEKDHVDINNDKKCDVCDAVLLAGNLKPGDGLEFITFHLPADIAAPIVTPVINFDVTKQITVTAADNATWYVNGTQRGTDTLSINIDVDSLVLGDNVIRVVIGNFSRNITFKVVLD